MTEVHEHQKEIVEKISEKSTHQMKWLRDEAKKYNESQGQSPWVPNRKRKPRIGKINTTK